MTDATDTMSLEELDKEIQRLQEEKQRVQALLESSEQRTARRLRRRYVFGQWLETMALNADQLAAIREVAGDKDGWLFDKDVIEADGWVLADSGIWSLSHAGASPPTEEERS